MKHGRLADFFFIGLGILPPALMFGGLPHLAILLFVPLLFVACLFGMAEQVEDRESATGDRADKAGSKRDGSSGKPVGLTFRKSQDESRRAKD